VEWRCGLESDYFVYWKCQGRYEERTICGKGASCGSAGLYKYAEVWERSLMCAGLFGSVFVCRDMRLVGKSIGSNIDME
jgi:hypothetical protein